MHIILLVSFFLLASCDSLYRIIGISQNDVLYYPYGHTAHPSFIFASQEKFLEAKYFLVDEYTIDDGHIYSSYAEYTLSNAGWITTRGGKDARFEIVGGKLVVNGLTWLLCDPDEGWDEGVKFWGWTDSDIPPSCEKVDIIAIHT
ncbi:hypothetical protein NEOLI_004337 [Neolecta irregularis DAH-3]|uniref:Uncharacterized protein n=1 Tax=Neolecta irregularis (strain DAH-3) TaxID=1198029 RepID=A0A1U7LM21_NEOID|nr:hypothetical protein NEOLI_004337 [Neolecta irregularis DAH-3]|eukprot:OLL23697.1 hypothetical protein NEOLI_004337 [Neolecta irregularis DAH-3]